MNRREYLLTKLQEECAEVSQRAAKQIQFGRDQIQKAGEVANGSGPAPKEVGLTNGQRLKAEILDLLVIIKLLEGAETWVGQEEISAIKVDEFEVAYTAKTKKLNKYLTFARSLGYLEGNWTV